MTPLTALWLPILLSAVFVFIASSVIHMLLGWHAGDYSPVPDEARFADAVRPLALPPGDYLIPRPGSMKEMGTPEFLEKRKAGPVMIFTVFPNGVTGMGAQLFQWFLYSVVVSIFAGYIAGRALGSGHVYLDVFRFVGATAFIAYSVALWQMSIWYRRRWRTTIMATIDGLIYALLTAGVFGWLWPR
ncbi:MAG: hypothetical protein ABR517_05525 [Thermoanaerobaculia bacterium]